MELLKNLHDRQKYRNKVGIYALVYHNSIIYIGQSVNLYNRLSCHNGKHQYEQTQKKCKKENGSCNRKKQLAMYAFIKEHRDEISFKILKECDQQELNKWEECYITQYQPQYNYTGVDIPYKGRKI